VESSTAVAARISTTEAAASAEAAAAMEAAATAEAAATVVTTAAMSAMVLGDCGRCRKCAYAHDERGARQEHSELMRKLRHFDLQSPASLAPSTRRVNRLKKNEHKRAQVSRLRRCTMV
jgi:hypothetical protein